MARLIQVDEAVQNSNTLLNKLLNAARITGLRNTLGALLTIAIGSLTRTKGIIKVATDIHTLFTAAHTFWVKSSTGNDGEYTIGTSTYTSPNTFLTVNNPVPSSVADGNVQYNYDVAVAAVDQSAVAAHGSVTIVSASTETTTGITVHGVQVMSGTVTYATSSNATATAIAANITAFAATGGYTATVAGNVITITSVATGTTPNGYVILASGTATFSAYVALSGGLNAKTFSVAGDIHSLISAATTHNIIAVDNTNNSFSIAGDHTNYPERVGYLSVAGSTGNDGSYTVTNAIYDGTTNTKIFVAESIASAVPDGTVAYEGVIVVTDSTGNDGVYRVVSTAFNSPNTDITVTEAIPDPTVDGTITYLFNIAVAAVTTSTMAVIVTGDKRNVLDVNTPFTIAGSTGNNGAYTVKSISYSSPNSTITINEYLPSATADGNVLVDDTQCELTYILEKGSQSDKVLDQTESQVTALMNAVTGSNNLQSIAVTVLGLDNIQPGQYPAYTTGLNILSILDVVTDPDNSTGSIITLWNKGDAGPKQYFVAESKSAILTAANS